MVGERDDTTNTEVSTTNVKVVNLARNIFSIRNSNPFLLKVTAPILD